MNAKFKETILRLTSAEAIIDIEEVQELWSGFGQVQRVYLKGTTVPSIIVKRVNLKGEIKHPRGWGSEISFKRKEYSYRVEQLWYENYSDKSVMEPRMAKFLGATKDEAGSMILLEDLNASGFPIRKSSLSIKEVKACVQWLANFHGRFIGHSLNGLWEIGTYWHLATRKEEFNKMNDSNLKRNAVKIDYALNSCKYQSLVHGDAKVANFCFSEDGEKVAVVDFQYVGGGCGMKDVAYLFSSCMDAKDCSLWASHLVDYYFESLFVAVNGKISDQDFALLENEWREMYLLAWADFCRFLEGWAPGHYKLNDYSRQMVKNALAVLPKLN